MEVHLPTLVSCRTVQGLALRECMLYFDGAFLTSQQQLSERAMHAERRKMSPWRAGAADAGDAAEALAALQGSAANATPPAPLLEHPGAATSAVHPQAPGAPPQTNPPGPGQRIPGMGRGTSLYRGVSKVG